ncbi:MAG: hypothetical protein GYA59_15660 [Chloroflexi bacterium]|nr:hypothetical protein [Chloroflexota bacterium]
MSDETTPTYCVNHPQRPTMLRCNRCERPICAECAVLTPTGYRCKDCVRSQQKIFDTARWIDYPLAIGIAGGLSYLGSYLASFVGFFTIFLAPIAGVIIGEAIRWVVGRRRGEGVHGPSAGGVAGSLHLHRCQHGILPLERDQDRIIAKWNNEPYVT